MPTEIKPKYENIEYNTIPIHLTIYEVGVEKPSIIFIHGITLHAKVYEELLPGVNFLQALAQKGFNVVALDLQGHGKSGGERGIFTYQNLMGNISKTVDYTIEHYNPKIGICGSSMGGILAFYGAITDSRIRAAVCHGVADLRKIDSVPYLRYKTLKKPFLKFLQFFNRYFPKISIPLTVFVTPNHIFKKKENIKKWQKDPLCVWNYRASSWVSLFLNPKEKPSIEEMQKPTRIIIGEKDSIFLSSFVQNFYERLRCKKDLVIVPGAGHMLPLEYPSLTVPLIVEWFRENL